jgi:hypothetical protein
MCMQWPEISVGVLLPVPRLATPFVAFPVAVLERMARVRAPALLMNMAHAPTCLILPRPLLGPP